MNRIIESGVITNKWYQSRAVCHNSCLPELRSAISISGFLAACPSPVCPLLFPPASAFIACVGDSVGCCDIVWPSFMLEYQLRWVYFHPNAGDILWISSCRWTPSCYCDSIEVSGICCVFETATWWLRSLWTVAAWGAEKSAELSLDGDGRDCPFIVFLHWVWTMY